MRTLVKLGGVGAAVIALALQATAPADAALGVPFTNSAVDRIYGGGSDTTYTLMNDLASAFHESDGCLLNAASFPLTGTSPTQNQCQSGAGAAITGDNIYENYDHDMVINFFPQGSNAGRGQLCNQKTSADGSGPNKDPRVPYIDFARSSSAPGTGFQCTVANGGESGTALNFVAFARDAISWTHWNTGGGGGGAAVTNLTVAQLRDIFITCAITQWGAVGGEAGEPIIVYTAIPGSGTRSTWEGFLGGGNSETCIPAQFKDGNVGNGERVVREHQMEPVEQAFNDPGAANESNSIYYMSFGLHESNPGFAGSSLIGNVNGIVPNETTIVDGTFPFSRNMYNVYRTGPNSPVANQAVRRFIAMIGNPTPTNVQNVGWICKGDPYHSEQVGNPSAEGIEDPTATQDWAEIKEAAFEANGMFQLAADPARQLHRCELPVLVTVP